MPPLPASSVDMGEFLFFKKHSRALVIQVSSDLSDGPSGAMAGGWPAVDAPAGTCHPPPNILQVSVWFSCQSGGIALNCVGFLGGVSPL